MLRRLLWVPVLTVSFLVVGAGAAFACGGLVAPGHAEVLAALSREPATLSTLVERAYADTPRELWGYAERSLLAHLLKLEAERHATREGERWSRVDP